MPAKPEPSQSGSEPKRPAGAGVVVSVPVPGGGSLGAIAMGLFVSAEDQAHIDAMRVRSYELAVARGHVRR